MQESEKKSLHESRGSFLAAWGMPLGGVEGRGRVSRRESTVGAAQRR